MPWRYIQSTGELKTPLGAVLAIGYSGRADGRNNPEMEIVANVGPIPEGFYTIEYPRDTDKHGPYALPLEPFVDNVMHGRSAFLIHGDNQLMNFTASEGCIIMPRWARERVWESGDDELQVVAREESTA